MVTPVPRISTTAENTRRMAGWRERPVQAGPRRATRDNSSARAQGRLVSARIIVIGGGIGGLTAAIGLRGAGFAVEVYERAAQLRPVGAGLTIQPNAVLALRRLGHGLAERIERAGAALRAGGLLRADGRAITELRPQFSARLAQEVGAGSVGIHRATLHAILLDALGSDALHLGRAFRGFTPRGAQVIAEFEDGSRREADALIGADGLHSSVRAQLLGDAEPRYAGYTSWRGVTADRCGLPDDFGGEMWGRGQRFGGCCIDGGRFYWFAVAAAPAGQREADPEQAKRALLERYAGWGGRVPELLRSTPAAAILRTDISDRAPSARWGEGRVTLLGDAAHPMTPNLGQGACQAIEDALALAEALRAAASLEAGLRAYEARRIARANAAVLAARRLGAIAQWQNPVACALRNALFGVLPSAVVERQLLDSWKLP
jgi:2-polyprenyl-6-methoxyphenol hydroxylase-like FAD-dependent oxidoreductase